ncbi:hypothetical protein PIB30_032598 [Stylosanthes scabra]|uniref:Uncharacterized protein n=1 Tax=Stylosanthes scabra TaxID=79078 RepID=A0ABU6TBW6_9FABA|nr:hypothetical protein [Stylosanthes scabra]
MSTFPPAEFASLASTYCMTRAFHDPAGASSSHAPPPPPPPSSDVQHGAWVPTYSSPLVIGFSVFDPRRIGSDAPFPSATQSQQSPVDPAQSAEATQAPRPRRTTREVRPPPCGTDGHMHPPGGEH